MINNKCKLNNNTLTHKEQLYHFKTFHHCETRNQPAWVSTGSWLLTAWLLTQNYTFISLLSQKWNESVLPSAIQNIKKVGILPIRIVTSNVLSVRPFVREKKQLHPDSLSLTTTLWLFSSPEAAWLESGIIITGAFRLASYNLINS